ncbi:MAG: molybdopterin molybdotransferase MoeA [Clostridium sp.]|nr:molybdopterin molybdotransferase MoeA [Clostridium sp.]
MKKRNPITIESAQERLNQIAIQVKTEIIPSLETLGRVCAQDVFSIMDQPPFPRSPLDGYAVRSQDTQGASRENPIQLNVIEHVYAGMCPMNEVGPGEAVRIMTGAPIPQGADGVIMQEQTDEGVERVQVYRPVTAYGNYCRKGEDMEAGVLLFEKGTCIRHMHIGIMASQGIEQTKVYKVPKIGIMATGDELVAVGDPLSPGKIYDSNGPLLTSRVTELGCCPFQIKAAGDSPEVLAQAIESALGRCDAVVTSGGVSVGVRDCMPDVAKLIGANVLFHGIDAKPGSPMMVMVVEGKLVFCLSGNPFAAAATFEVMVRPQLERMRGRSNWKPRRVWGKLGTAFPKPSGMRRLVRGRIEDGTVWLPEGRHSSGMLASMADCNCLVDIPAGSGDLEVNAEVEVILL